MSVIAGLFMVLFGRLLGPRRWAAAALLGVLLYTLLVGAAPAVVRAALLRMRLRTAIMCWRSAKLCSVRMTVN